MNLFTTGEPISALSHESFNPKSKTKPLENDESPSFVGDAAACSGIVEFEPDRRDKLSSVAFFLSVFGFAEQ